MSGLGIGSTTMALIAALLLGLRHATDPDHLTAIGALVIGEPASGSERSSRGSTLRPSARRASVLGLSWGMGHAATFLLLGLPVVLLSMEIPEVVQAAAEMSIGLLIAFLAIRLMQRWRQGHFHTHPHVHVGAEGERIRHEHGHFHESHTGATKRVEHEHRHGEVLGRSPWAAFGIGLIHGVGGSAAAGIVVVAASTTAREAALALTIFATATAISMAAVSAIVGCALVWRSSPLRMQRLVPAFSVASFVFGVWYAVV